MPWIFRLAWGLQRGESAAEPTEDEKLDVFLGYFARMREYRDDRYAMHRVKHKISRMAKHINADSLAFISIDGLYRAVGREGRNKSCPQFCDACFTGDYPTRLTDVSRREQGSAQLSFPVSKPVDEPV